MRLVLGSGRGEAGVVDVLLRFGVAVSFSMALVF